MCPANVSFLKDNVVSSHRKGQGSIPGQAWIFFRFFSNRLGCSFYREDHFHFPFFIRSSKHDNLKTSYLAFIIEASPSGIITLG